MAAGYVAIWIPLLEAIQHVQRVAGGTLVDARDNLLIALREAGVASRYRGQDVGGVAAQIEGRSGGVPPARWYGATVYDDGSVEFADNPYYPFPRRYDLARQQIEVLWSDLLRWWPAPPEAAETAAPPGTASAPEVAPKNRERGHGPQSEAPGREGRRGRKPGSGSYNDDDALTHMLGLLASGEAQSVHAAAVIASDKHQKGHSRDADIGRLRRKFASKFGTKPPPGKTWADVENQLKTN